MKTFRKILAMALILTVIGGNTSYAAGAVNPADQDDSAVIEETLATAVTENGKDLETIPRNDNARISSIDLISNSGVTDGNWSASYSSPYVYANSVKLVMSCKYADGHVGDVKVRIGGYTYTVRADGTARIVGSRMTLSSGTNTLVIENSGGKMSYYVHLYVEN